MGNGSKIKRGGGNWFQFEYVLFELIERIVIYGGGGTLLIRDGDPSCWGKDIF